MNLTAPHGRRCSCCDGNGIMQKDPGNRVAELEFAIAEHREKAMVYKQHDAELYAALDRRAGDLHEAFSLPRRVAAAIEFCQAVGNEDLGMDMEGVAAQVTKLLSPKPQPEDLSAILAEVAASLGAPQAPLVDLPGIAAGIIYRRDKDRATLAEIAAATGYPNVYDVFLPALVSVFVAEARKTTQDLTVTRAERDAARKEISELRALYREFQEKHGITLEDGDASKPGTLAHLIAERDALKAESERVRKANAAIYDSVACLCSEGVEFMTRVELARAVESEIRALTGREG